MGLRSGLNFIESCSVFFLSNSIFLNCMAAKSDNITTINWAVKEATFTRLCEKKKMLTMNGMFPEPALHVHKGDTVRVNVQNQGKYNITIHWHGVKQPTNPWSDGPAYITQCPIKAGANFSYEIIFSTEEGTLWWHAHSDWSRATVHGPIFIYPEHGTSYPFPKPHVEVPVVMVSWFKGDVMEIMEEAVASGGEFNQSNAFTLNGQPGDFFNCSKQDTFKMIVDYGKTYLLRIINAVMNEEMFFAVAGHNLTVGMDGAYVKPLKTSYIMITPGQTMDILITTNQNPSHYYMAARAYADVGRQVFDNTTTTAIFQYNGKYTSPSSPSFPSLPNFMDTNAVTGFTNRIKALASKEHPVNVPKKINNRLIITISMNLSPCSSRICAGPRNRSFASSLNNISFTLPEIDVLQAYYQNINNVYETNFPEMPPNVFNYTAFNVSENYTTPERGTKVRVLNYDSNVEIVFQGTNVLNSSENHPMHLHGYSFYVVGLGFGNFNHGSDPQRYNLVDPPEVNTVGVPKNGWTAIRFKADNPGVWFMHCHLDRHTTWGMDAVLIVKNGTTKETSMRQPPHYLNPC